jgi:hypothetical protein
LSSAHSQSTHLKVGFRCRFLLSALSVQILLEATSSAEGSKALENVLRAYIAGPVNVALATAAAAAAAAAEASGGGGAAGAGGKLKSGDGEDSGDAVASSSSSSSSSSARGAISPSSPSSSASAARNPADARDTRRASGLNKLTSSLTNRIKQLTTAGVGGSASASAAAVAGGLSMAISLPSHPTLQVF